jgi:hypothetical protein
MIKGIGAGAGVRLDDMLATRRSPGAKKGMKLNSQGGKSDCQGRWLWRSDELTGFGQLN